MADVSPEMVATLITAPCRSGRTGDTDATIVSSHWTVL
jgi:hypothetical protein